MAKNDKKTLTLGDCTTKNGKIIAGNIGQKVRAALDGMEYGELCQSATELAEAALPSWPVNKVQNAMNRGAQQGRRMRTGPESYVYGSKETIAALIAGGQEWVAGA